VTATEPIARLIALYLPQFYPTAENDRWWGPGFTEWTNVAAANPLFPGHRQPVLPADVGFYDLRLPEVRQQQAELAAASGIEAFCYWHYWFGGRRLLDRPFDEVLASGSPDFPFCLAWANESWARRWHGSGSDGDVLMAQTYSAEDDLAHARWLAGAFADPRWVRVDGRSLLLIYRPESLPDARRTTDTIREVAVASGVAEPYLVGMDAHQPNADMRQMGFDATLRFEPQLSVLPAARRGATGPAVHDYLQSVGRMRATPLGAAEHQGVFLSWDNTPRRGVDGVVFSGSNPESFERSLSGAIERVRDQPIERRLVFLNAWNEWAEGNHLEPDLVHGRGWLDAVRRQAFGLAAAAARP
jgi:lipopolysaccharide biosynthesis protein